MICFFIAPNYKLLRNNHKVMSDVTFAYSGVMNNAQHKTSNTTAATHQNEVKDDHADNTSIDKSDSNSKLNVNNNNNNNSNQDLNSNSNSIPSNNDQHNENEGNDIILYYIYILYPQLLLLFFF